MNMPFGKYRGVEIADLPDDYLQWLCAIELREPLRGAVHVEFELRFTKCDTHASLSTDARVMAQELISAGYRKLAAQHHPDHGGETHAMQLVNRAAEFLHQVVRST